LLYFYVDDADSNSINTKATKLATPIRNNKYQKSATKDAYKIPTK
jgi:hypothetical protein